MVSGENRTDIPKIMKIMEAIFFESSCIYQNIISKVLILCLSLHSGHTVALSQRGGLGICTDRDQRSIFGGFEFRKSVFFWGGGGVLVTAAVFFGVVRRMLYF